MSTAAETVPTECPQCGGDLWDNRADNAKKHDGRRRPDFRCKEDRDHVIWPPSEKKGAASKSNGKQGYSAGDLPGDPAPRTEEEKEEALKRLGALHRRCLVSALSESKAMEDAKVGDSPEAASARCAQLFIAATQAGLHR